jgi:hypothetical protein
VIGEFVAAGTYPWIPGLARPVQYALPIVSGASWLLKRAQRKQDACHAKPRRGLVNFIESY